MYTTLEKIKKHLNIEQSYTADDEYLLDLYDVAEKTVEAHIDMPLCDLAIDGELVSPLRHAILLYIGDLYNSREGNAYGINISPVPFGYDYLLSLYKNYAPVGCQSSRTKLCADTVEGNAIEINPTPCLNADLTTDGDIALNMCKGYADMNEETGEIIIITR